MKCDEEKPECENCTRLKKRCAYLYKWKFKMVQQQAAAEGVVEEVVGADIHGELAPGDVRRGSSLIEASSGNFVFESKQARTTLKRQSTTFKPGPMKHTRSSSGSRPSSIDSHTSESTPLSSSMLPLASTLRTLPLTSTLRTLTSTLRTLPLEYPNDRMHPLNESKLEHISVDHFPISANRRFTNQISDILGDASGGSSGEISRARTGPASAYSLAGLANTLITQIQSAQPPAPQNMKDIPTPSSPPSICDYNPATTTSDLLREIVSRNNLSAPQISYLTAVAETDLSFHLFPFADATELNPVVKILLTYAVDCPYLLTSILAIAATFLYNQSRDAMHDRCRQEYISYCLRSLSHVFKSKHDDHVSGSIFMNNIERLLLTIMVLTSTFTATYEPVTSPLILGWRTHLRGARDLLSKYNEVVSVPGKSGGLALAKTWFYTVECLDKLNGQDFEDDIITTTPEELFGGDAKVIYYDALGEVGITSGVSKFNLFMGYSPTYVALSKEFVKVFFGSDRSAEAVFRLMYFLQSARNTQYAAGVQKSTHVIPRSSPAHPDYAGINKVTIPNGCMTEYDGVVYSWFDLCEQVRVDSLYLRTLTGIWNLPKEHPLVQQTVERMLLGAFFVRDKPVSVQVSSLLESKNHFLPIKLFDARAIMVQGAYRICLLHILAGNEGQFEKIELILRGLVSLGNGSAQVALEKFYRVREGINDKGEEVIPFA